MSSFESGENKPKREKLNKGIIGDFPFAETLRNGKELALLGTSLALIVWGGAGAIIANNFFDFGNQANVNFYENSINIMRAGLVGTAAEIANRFVREFGSGSYHTVKNWYKSR